MASNGTTIGAMGTILFIAIFFLTAFNFLGEEVQTKNTNLDTKSLNILTTLDYGTSNTYNNGSLVGTPSQFGTNGTNVSYVNVDPYSRQYLEDKGESIENEGIVSKLVNLPSFLFLLIGIPLTEEAIILLNIVGLFIALLIGFAIYKFLKGEVD